MRSLLAAGFLCALAFPLLGKVETPPAPVAANAQAPADVALQLACAQGDLAGVNAALAQGGRPFTLDKNNWTPLAYAAANGHVDIVKLLLSKGAQLEEPCDGGTALNFACKYDQHDAAMALIDAGAECGAADGRPPDELLPLDWAAGNGDIPLITALLDHHIDVNQTNHRNTALLHAMLNDKWDAMQFLFSKGADPNVPDTGEHDGNTPLILAAKWDWADDNHKAQAITLLLQAKANPNFRARDGMTAVLGLARFEEPKALKLLLDAGADPDATLPGNADTALIISGNRGWLDMVNLLKSHGAKITDIYIIEHQKPDPPPTAEQAWALAMGAVYDLRYGRNPFTLTTDDQGSAKWAARVSSNVHNRDEALAQLDQLLNTGCRAEIQQRGADLENPSPSNPILQMILDPYGSTDETNGQKLDSYRKWKDRDGLAFDLAASVNYIKTDYSAGYITEDEAWSRLFALARMAQKNFHSWSEFSDNFLDGRKAYGGNFPEAFEVCTQLLINKNDPNSAWNQSAWDTPLPAGP
jgi:ankyrin repeat protein